MQNEKRIVSSMATMLFSIIAGVILSLVSSLLIERFFLGSETNNYEEPDISTRLEIITESLSQNANDLKSIETELENRISYVEDLNAKAEAAESILNVSETQINAIHSMISEELDVNNKKNFWPTVLNNFCFCILGMIIPPLSKMIIKKIKK